MLDGKPHPEAGGVPSRRAQPTEQRMRGGGLVEMERLRIKARRKRLDLFGCERVAADLGLVADGDVLEEPHQPDTSSRLASAAARRANIGLTLNVIRHAPEESTSSNRNLTKPSSGRLREGLISSTVARARMLSPGRNGLSQRTSSMPGAPMKCDWAIKPSLSRRISRQQLCQPDAASAPSMLARAASSSRCIGCGSYAAANSTISSRVTRRGSDSKTLPGVKSSQWRGGTAISGLKNERLPMTYSNQGKSAHRWPCCPIPVTKWAQRQPIHASIDPKRPQVQSPAPRPSRGGLMLDLRDLFQWERFITPSIIKVFYWLAVGLSVLFGLSNIFAGLYMLTVNPFGGLLLIVASLIGALMGILVARIASEFVLITFRINEHLGAIRNRGQF